MPATDFTKKGLNQQIFSSKTARAVAAKNSSAFREIMKNKGIAHVISKVAEKRVFYNALKKRGLESKKGITRNVFKKVLGDIEHSGEFSHEEIHHLGRELVGGPASERIIRDHAHEGSASTEMKPAVNMRSVFQEIMEKNPHRKAGQNQHETAESAKQNATTSVVNFSVSNKNVRNVENYLSQRKEQLNPSTMPRQYAAEKPNFTKLLRQYSDNENIEEVKSLLAKIQDSGNNAATNKIDDNT